MYVLRCPISFFCTGYFYMNMQAYLLIYGIDFNHSKTLLKYVSLVI